MENSHKDKQVLVTGGTGFIGIHTILQLLQKGYTVKTTVRSLNRKDYVLETLKSAGIESFENLSFIEADLTKDHNWKEAVEGCDYVLHVASPFPLAEPEDENELIIPAKEGALRVLKAARDAGVKRVVLTSSFAAVGYSIEQKNHIFTEEDWTDADLVDHAYIKSKTLAEKAAWDFIKNEGNGLELSVVNPVGVFGPALGNDYSSSVLIVKNVLDGTIRENIFTVFGIVDVRDVADLHIKAMTDPAAKGERFLATVDGVMSVYDIVKLIKEKRSEAAGKVADFSPIDESYYTMSISNEKARKVLGWKPRTKEEAILATVDSL